MGSNPLVSIITPSFQQADYLRQCIDSVLGHGYQPIEYHVCDGGSIDGSVDILRSYGIRLEWDSQPDGGQAAAINVGLRKSQGQIVGFLNSDDVLLPGAVGSAVRTLAAHPEVDIVYGRATVIDEQGRALRPAPVQSFDADVLVQHCFIAQPAAFWRRSLHEKIGWFAEEFDHTLDYEFWIRAMQAGAKFLFVDEEWAQAREHAQAKSQRLRGEILRQIRELQLRRLGYCGRNWWEQHLRYLRDEKRGIWRLLPGRRDQRLYRLAWWPYVFWRRKLGGPLFYRPGHWRA
ncbi:glycosyltransferase family 2 protein [Opitutus terrae]|uniref:Glycosyl transferase family 2 n=1 Tax=Opitutus terrae (strain DSM 11246 / JCM 15787 / PB90-1) TaxID=452637 RepID=B1ZZP3_OPITP|nr:glycosyltransferase family 2 protein [Opitutus terrae]ACB77229.1 glycosyl transferase family 2 [Opitutus terrae PB90-1]